jgi:hypothetical protein
MFASAAMLAILLAALTGAVAAQPAQPPHPPCGGAPVPAWPQPGAAPNVRLWNSSDLAPDWTPPACTSWRGGVTLVTGLAGRFQLDGNADTLLARIGAISALSGVRYWSVTDKQWNALFTRATALNGPDPKKPRGDFSAAEMRSGGLLYFVAADYRSGKDAMSRLHVVEADAAHIVVETENVSPLRWTFLTFAAPGNFQTWYFLERDGDGWRFYSLTRVLYASALFNSIIPGDSYINRAVAMYRHIIGQPTDRDPPAAP